MDQPRAKFCVECGARLLPQAFRCHACGVKGGDVIALHRLITGMGFAEAVRDLGGRFHE